MKRPVAITVIPLFAGLLAGCSFIPSVGPSYEPPAPTVPDTWESTSPRTPEAQEEIDGLTSWWEKFGDGVLTAAVERAREQNFNLEVARSRIVEARAAMRISTAGFFPDIDAGGSWSRIAQSSTTAGIPPGIPLLTKGWEAGFSTSWEIDLFGGTRRTYEAAGAALEATEADYIAAHISILAEVARTFVGVRALEKRLDVNRKNLKAQQENLDIVQARFDAGLVSELDVAQARTLLGQTRAVVPELESAHRAQVSALGVLLNLLPEETEALLARDASPTLLATQPPAIPVVLPSELLRRRPDVIRAERTLAARTASVGVAMADLFPRFSLSGAFGQASERWGSLFDGDSRAWSFIPGVRLPIFHGGEIFANVDIQEERTAQALADYRKTVLTAISETESAITDYQKQQERKIALREAWESSERALDLSRDLYREGVADFQRVLEAERSALAVEDALVRSEQDTLSAAIALYRTLGGGWEWERRGAEAR